LGSITISYPTRATTEATNKSFIGIQALQVEKQIRLINYENNWDGDYKISS
jgi:hypothetical protein